ncbi:DUF2199 domain-containing protein [Kribbella orskensis]|nr:DUF2199 domain-containing protein [Kribbella orskensis]
MDLRFRCSCCGELHAELPMAFHLEAPVYWSPEMADSPDCELTSDQCVINREHFFVRGLIEIPVLDSEESFAWGVWVSLSEKSFAHISDHWETEGREHDDPYFGWLSSALDYDPTTVNLATNLHSRPVGVRPFIELEPTDHPLAVEQRNGITLARVQEIAEHALHPNN